MNLNRLWPLKAIVYSHTEGTASALHVLRGRNRLQTHVEQIEKHVGRRAVKPEERVKVLAETEEEEDRERLTVKNHMYSSPKLR